MPPHVGFTRHILEHLINFDQLIKFAVEQNASDLHFQTGAALLLRINGQMRNAAAKAGAQHPCSVRKEPGRESRSGSISNR